MNLIIKKIVSVSIGGVLFVGCGMTMPNTYNQKDFKELTQDNGNSLLTQSIKQKNKKRDYFYLYQDETISSALKDLSALEKSYYYLKGEDIDVPIGQNIKIKNFKELDDIVKTLTNYKLTITKNKFRRDLPKVVEIKEQKKSSILDKVQFESLSLNVPNKLFYELGKYARGWKIVGGHDIQTDLNQNQFVNFRGSLREFLDYFAQTNNLFIDYDYDNKIISFSKYKVKRYPLKVVNESYSYNNKFGTDIEYESGDSSSNTKKNQGTVTVKNSYDFQASLKTLLDKMIGKGDSQEYWDFVKPTNELVVKTTRDKMKTIENIVNNINATSFKSVSITVRIFETTLNKNFQYGINWGYIANKLNTSGAMTRAFTFGTDAIVPSIDNTLSSPQIIKLGNGSGINAVLNLMNQFGTVRVGNGATVETINNVPALYSLADRTGYISNYSVNTTSGVDMSSLSIEQKKAVGGEYLYIKPTIFNDQILINLKMVLARVNSITKQEFSNGQYVQTPDDTRKNYSQNIVLKDGEKVVIGGLVVNSIRNGYNGSSPFEKNPLSLLAGVQADDHQKQEIAIVIAVKELKN